MALLFAVAFSQCVDDLLCREPKRRLCMLGRPEGTDSDLWSGTPMTRVHRRQLHIAHIVHEVPGRTSQGFQGTNSAGICWNKWEQLSGLLLSIKQSRQLCLDLLGRCGASWLLSDSKIRKVWPCQAQAFHEAAARAWTSGLTYTLFSAIHW